MAIYDALRHITIGQYLPTGSFVHQLDPRAKIVGLVLLGVAAIIDTSYTLNAALLLLLAVLIRLGRLPLRYILSSIAPALPIIVVLAALQFLFYGRSYAGLGGPSRILISWGPILVSTASVRLVVVSLMRFLNLLFLTSLLTNTTTVTALTHGVEGLLRPLSRIGLPSHEIALVGAIALRFLPILGEQLESITKAQAARGVAVDAKSRWHPISNARRLAGLIVPLFVDAYRRSEEMISAMLARCYQGGKGRTHLVELTLALPDYLALIASALILTGAIAVRPLALP